MVKLHPRTHRVEEIEYLLNALELTRHVLDGAGRNHHANDHAHKHQQKAGPQQGPPDFAHFRVSYVLLMYVVLRMEEAAHRCEFRKRAVAFRPQIRARHATWVYVTPAEAAALIRLPTDDLYGHSAAAAGKQVELPMTA
ncbi:hypothetical protein GCM10028796_49930 [Ramlibacter monticola]|uniref:Uncharacterized protein n=1 Tax=Ramlibacter monticola TaxID=1926872 RepID=A0A936YY93_9BURK|nr:hypothetical protein [Ramlibacter monticola]MBL0390839.1 hypothetical protein [Ramlibacter monticola]